MKTGWVVIAIFLAARSVAADAPVSLDRSARVPDFCQTDPAGQFPDRGKDYCGPVAAANALMYLAADGFPKLRPPADTDREAQIAMIRALGSSGYMDTAAKDGTSPPRLMAGVNRCVGQAGYRIARLEQQGWKESTTQFPAKDSVPSLEWIKEGCSSTGGVACLNVGWYKVEDGTNSYRRLGGHWVTLAGYGRGRDGRDDPLMIIIHDPSPRTGTNPCSQWVRLAMIENGTLQRRLPSGRLLRRDAKGFFEMKGDMKLKTGADAAILDAAVVLVVR